MSTPQDLETTIDEFLSNNERRFEHKFGDAQRAALKAEMLTWMNKPVEESDDYLQHVDECALLEAEEQAGDDVEKRNRILINILALEMKDLQEELGEAQGDMEKLQEELRLKDKQHEMNLKIKQDLMDSYDKIISDQLARLKKTRGAKATPQPTGVRSPIFNSFP